jgi:hypothetical protein
MFCCIIAKVFPNSLAVSDVHRRTQKPAARPFGMRRRRKRRPNRTALKDVLIRKKRCEARAFGPEIGSPLVGIAAALDANRV